MSNIAVMASGTGSNCVCIMQYFKQSAKHRVALVIASKPTALVLQRAIEFKIPTLVLDKKTFYETDYLLGDLKKYQIDFIALAGFLWKIPDYLIRAFPEKIVNIHPALLPKFGGKGMYGTAVHKAVIVAGEKESGITIHKVNEMYDNGAILYQEKCPVLDTDDYQTLAARVLKIEHANFARIIGQQLNNLQ